MKCWPRRTCRCGKGVERLCYHIIIIVSISSLSFLNTKHNGEFLHDYHYQISLELAVSLNGVCGQVGEVYPALHSAEAAVDLCPNWWVGLQTLGRAQLGLGEVGLAVKTFSRAVHIRPDQQELWREDLQVNHCSASLPGQSVNVTLNYCCHFVSFGLEWNFKKLSMYRSFSLALDDLPEYINDYQKLKE